MSSLLPDVCYCKAPNGLARPALFATGFETAAGLAAGVGTGLAGAAALEAVAVPAAAGTALAESVDALAGAGVAARRTARRTGLTGAGATSACGVTRMGSPRASRISFATLSASLRVEPLTSLTL